MRSTKATAPEERPWTGTGSGGTCWEGAFLGLEGRVFYKAAFLSPSSVGDSCMFYRGTDLGFAGILASRRVKLLRTSANDYEYLVQARQKSSTAVGAFLGGRGGERRRAGRSTR